MRYGSASGALRASPTERMDMSGTPAKTPNTTPKRTGARAGARTAARAGAAAIPRAQSVHRILRKAIIEQALRPGAKLPEDAIGEKLGVSRTLVREALARLALEELVEIKPNKGARVAYPTIEEARDVFDVRRGLERMVTESLAGRLKADQVAALERHIQSDEQACERDGPESIRLAGEFHVMLAAMTGNSLLLRYVEEVSSRCSLILAIYGRPHSSECAVSEHRQVLEALQAGDARKAADVMDNHLQAVASRALIQRRADPDLGELLARYALNEGLAKIGRGASPKSALKP
jgi:DNA-binding GntR family transcriptional regulator